MRFKEHKTKCSVLKVKQTQDFGATIHVIVGNGTLQKSDEIKALLLLPHEAQRVQPDGRGERVGGS